MNHPELLPFKENKTSINLHCVKCGKYKSKNQDLNCVRPAYLVKTLKKLYSCLKMRCKICEKVVKCANVPTRTRRICGNCLRSLIKLINTAPIRVNNG